MENKIEYLTDFELYATSVKSEFESLSNSLGFVTKLIFKVKPVRLFFLKKIMKVKKKTNGLSYEFDALIILDSLLSSDLLKYTNQDDDDFVNKVEKLKERLSSPILKIIANNIACLSTCKIDPINPVAKPISDELLKYAPSSIRLSAKSEDYAFCQLAYELYELRSFTKNSCINLGQSLAGAIADSINYLINDGKFINLGSIEANSQKRMLINHLSNSCSNSESSFSSSSVNNELNKKDNLECKESRKSKRL